MKVKTKIKLIMLMLVVMAAALFAGCTIGPESYEDFIARNAKASITYYGNGGIFNNNSNMTSLYVGYPDPENQPPLEITSDSDPEVTYTRYVFVHWVYVQVDENGEPLFEDEEKKKPLLTDEVVNFSTLSLHVGDRIYVSAVWALDVALDYVLVCDEAITISERVVNEEGVTVTQERVCEPGSVIYSESYGANSSLSVSDISKVTSTDSTYLEYYIDEDCTQTALQASYARPDNGVNNRVYAKYIPGVYTVVKTAAQVRTMLYTGLGRSSTSFYIYNDIDCSSVEANMSSSSFNCKIEGNGHTLSGIKFTQSSIGQGNTYSMLGSFGRTASIKDLTFEDIEVEASIRGDLASIYLVSSGISTGATFDNFVINNISLNITAIPDDYSIANIPTNVGGEYTTTNWIFGGVNIDTDADFIAAYPELVVTNASLIIKEVTIVENFNSNQAETTSVMAKTPYYIIRKENI